MPDKVVTTPGPCGWCGGGECVFLIPRDYPVEGSAYASEAAAIAALARVPGCQIYEPTDAWTVWTPGFTAGLFEASGSVTTAAIGAVAAQAAIKVVLLNGDSVGVAVAAEITAGTPGPGAAVSAGCLVFDSALSLVGFYVDTGTAGSPASSSGSVSITADGEYLLVITGSYDAQGGSSTATADVEVTIDADREPCPLRAVYDDGSGDEFVDCTP